MFDYKGKVVAITGASSGLGKQMAEGFAKCGADLVLMARRVERLDPMKRYGQPGELDAAAIFFGSEEASYVTGQVIAVDGGYVAI